ncbi:MAG: cysteine hydrolase [Oscillospiraceae bacterium]|nr:cysteine hydrolase [Oscillospiraceae bacterium]
MQRQALVVIDIQNDITKNYKDVIGQINRAVQWAVGREIPVVYIRHNNLSAGTRTFKPGTRGEELAPDLVVASEHIFTKSKGNALTSEAFAEFIRSRGLDSFYVTGADATACVKSTCYNMRQMGYEVTVLSDCVTSYDKRKIDEMLRYYESKGCRVTALQELIDGREN